MVPGRLLLVLTVTGGWGPVSHAQSAPKIDVEQACAAVAKVTVPAALMPSAAEAARVGKDCSPLDLYYRGGANRFQEARVCGLAQWSRMQRGAPGMTDTGDATGRTVEDEDQLLALAMVFANGQGVAKNLPLARRFACEADNFVDTDRVLLELDGGSLDVCSDNYGRRINFLCLGIHGAQVAGETAAAEARLRRTLPPRARAAWDALEMALGAFTLARGAEEPNGTTGAVQSGMEDELEADREWLTVLKEVQAGRVPAGMHHPGDAAQADGLLNRAYQASLKAAAQFCPDSTTESACTTPAQIRKAERAWLTYREAWVGFGAVRWPDVPADRWRTWLTEARTAQLN